MSGEIHALAYLTLRNTRWVRPRCVWNRQWTETQANNTARFVVTVLLKNSLNFYNVNSYCWKLLIELTRHHTAVDVTAFPQRGGCTRSFCLISERHPWFSRSRLWSVWCCFRSVYTRPMCSSHFHRSFSASFIIFDTFNSLSCCWYFLVIFGN
jgi:hypothetical protein